MPAQFREDVAQFLRDLEATQEELSTLFRSKREALVSAQADRLLSLAEREAELMVQMKSHLAIRGRILQQAEQQGLPYDSVASLAAVVGGEERAEIEQRVERVREMSDTLRRESWIHWIISHRAYNHYTQLLELIAHCGQKSPTYSSKPSQETSGGAILDASI